MASFQFRLYVTGASVRSLLAIENFRHICTREFGPDAEIEVIDVLREPERAEAERILTTPTLIRAYPDPVRRITGDLSDERAVLRALGVRESSPQPTPDGTDHG